MVHCCAQAVSRAQGTLNSNKDKIAADFAPERRAEGAAAIERLDAALKEFRESIQAGDKQARARLAAYAAGRLRHGVSC